MGDALSKIENFLFDIIGLALPGLIFLSIIFLPLSIIDISKIPIAAVDSSFILSELSTFSKILTTYWTTNSTIVLVFWFILSYLIGHLVKVFAIIKYEFFTAIFDKSLNKWIITLFNWTKFIVDKGYRKISNGNSIYNTVFYKWAKDIFYPFKNLLFKIFIFKPSDYFSDNDTLKTNCVSLINSRLNTTYPNKWYSVYKFSTVISNQESIKSLSSNFLAKYNLYRSLAFIFIVAAIYYYLFFKVANNYISSDIKKIGSLISIISALLWFTFHYKYKRYWTLCGNETLVSLFYFLNKKKINEN